MLRGCGRARKKLPRVANVSLDALGAELRTRLEEGGGARDSRSIFRSLRGSWGKRCATPWSIPKSPKFSLQAMRSERWEGDAFGELRHELPLDEIKEGLLRPETEWIRLLSGREVRKEGYARIFQIIARAESPLRVKTSGTLEVRRERGREKGG